MTTTDRKTRLLKLLAGSRTDDNGLDLAKFADMNVERAELLVAEYFVLLEDDGGSTLDNQAILEFARRWPGVASLHGYARHDLSVRFEGVAVSPAVLRRLTRAALEKLLEDFYESFVGSDEFVVAPRSAGLFACWTEP